MAPTTGVELTVAPPAVASEAHASALWPGVSHDGLVALQSQALPAAREGRRATTGTAALTGVVVQDDGAGRPLTNYCCLLLPGGGARSNSST